MSNTLILVGINNIIFSEFDPYISSDYHKSFSDQLTKLPSNFKYRGYYPCIVNAIKEWNSQNYEIRWLNENDYENELKVIYSLFDLPKFKVCDAKALSQEDLLRPIVLLTKTYYYFESKNYMWTCRG